MVSVSNVKCGMGGTTNLIGHTSINLIKLKHSINKRFYIYYIYTIKTGDIMDNNSASFTLKIIDKIKIELKEIEELNSYSEMKKRIRMLLKCIDDDTIGDKSAFLEIIYCKLKESKDSNPKLNTSLYLLYRNLIDDRISIQEAQKLFSMYIAEYEVL
jgi:ASC-1-like (ASCH) protein